MDEPQPSSSKFRALLPGLLFPPLGVFRAWRRLRAGWPLKILLSVFFLVYSVTVVAVVLFLLIQAGWIGLEWRGGFPPVLTFHETVPDYDAVEAHRDRLPIVEPAVLTNLASRSGGVYWTGFRGARRDGHYDEMPIRTDWPEGGLTPLWRQPVGGGYGSFAIAHGMAYTLEQRRDQEAIVAYEMLTGREVWRHDYPARFEESMGGEGPRSTPTWDEGRLYVLGAMGDFHCLDAASGQVLWSHQMLEEQNARNLYFGCSASPLIVGDQVIVVGGEGAYSLYAYDKRNGGILWKSVDEKPAYVSPMLVELAGRRQLLAPSASHAMGVDPEDGSVLWKYPWVVEHDLTIAQPVILGTNQFVLSAGYGKGAVCVEVNESGSGYTATQVWSTRFLKNKFTSSVLHEGFLYGLDESILTCLDAATGRREWKDGRYGYGQLLLAGGHLIILSGSGELVLVKATPEAHEEIASFPAIEGKTWNHPAMADGFLLIRNAVEMACYDLGLRASP